MSTTTRTIAALARLRTVLPGTRFLKFALVGGSGVVVNEAVTALFLWLLPNLGSLAARANLAVFMGWAVSVLSNYLLNYYWTWRDRTTGSADRQLQLLPRYYTSALAAFFVQLFVVNAFSAVSGWSTGLVLWWNLVGIGAGTVVNYIFADQWVFADGTKRGYGLPALLLVLLTAGIKLLAAGSIDLLPDEAYYWEWSRNLAWGYFDHPPMVAWLIALTTPAEGATPLMVRLSGFLASGCISLLVFDLTRRMFDGRTAFWSVVILNTTLLFTVGGLVATPDIPLILLWTLAIYLAWFAIDRDQLSWWLLAGLAAGLALLSKYTAVFLLPAGLIYLLVDKSNRRLLMRPGPYLFAALALAVFLPVIVWNYQNDWLSFRFQFAHGVGGTNRSVGWLLTQFLGGQMALVGPLLFPGLLWAIYYGLRFGQGKSRSNILFLAVISSFVLGLFMLAGLSSRGEANWPAPAYITGFPLLSAVYFATLHRYRSGRWLAGAALGLTVLVSGLALIEMHYQVLPVRPQRHPLARAQGWEQLAREVADQRDRLPDPLPIVTDRYQLSAQLAWHLAGQPLVPCFAPHRRSNQYQLWDTMAGMEGRDLLYVSKSSPLPVEISGYFDDTRLLRSVEITWRGEIIRTVHLYLCTSFHGR